MDARSSESVMQTVTGSVSGGRKRKSASGDRTRIGGEGESGRTARTPAGSGRRRVKKKKSVRQRRRRVKMWQTLLTLRGLPKTTKRRKVLKESGYEIRYQLRPFR